MSTAMDLARGGQFMIIPNPYPASAWYHYDDNTCDYECMAIEYIYWAQVSNMGILDDPQTASGIANEWEPYNARLLQSMDTLMYALITDAQYKLPQIAPDGNYCPNPSAITEIDSNRKLIKIVDVLGRTTKETKKQTLFYIYDNGSVKKVFSIE